MTIGKPLVRYFSWVSIKKSVICCSAWKMFFFLSSFHPYFIFVMIGYTYFLWTRWWFVFFCLVYFPQVDWTVSNDWSQKESWAGVCKGQNICCGWTKQLRYFNSINSLAGHTRFHVCFFPCLGMNSFTLFNWKTLSSTIKHVLVLSHQCCLLPFTSPLHCYLIFQILVLMTVKFRYAPLL